MPAAMIRVVLCSLPLFSAKQNISGYGPPQTERIIPQYLKPAGFATVAFGKWNLGFVAGARPTERGFDEFLGHAPIGRSLDSTDVTDVLAGKKRSAHQSLCWTWKQGKNESWQAIRASNRKLVRRSESEP
jgi:arylsulfatase A-like enzyme